MRAAAALALSSLVSLFFILSMAEGVVAQEAINVTSYRAENHFPERVQFIVFIESAQPVSSVRLRYEFSGGGAPASATATFTPGVAVRAEYDLATNNPGSGVYIPPGTVITYRWEIEDAAGNRITTEPETVVYEDTRFQWQSLTDGNLSIYWYRGGQTFAEQLLATGRETLTSMGDLLGAQIDFPVKVFLYDNAQDMRPALQRRSSVYDAQVHTLGQRVSNDTVIVLNAAGTSDTLRHELTHVVTNVAGKGPFSDIPAWLDEGTAVYSQKQVDDSYQRAIQAAARRDRLLPLRALNTLGSDPNSVNLWYAQAWSLVNYLIDTYGKEKFAELFATFKAGSTVENALQSVYGISQDELEAAWRESIGAPPPQPAARTTSTPQQGQQAAGAVTTPTTTSTASSTGAPAPAGDGLPLTQLLIIAVLAVVLIAAIGTGGLVLARRLPKE